MVNIELVKSLRLKQGYSQWYMSELMGYKAPGCYKNKELKIRKFSIEDIVKIASIFSVTPNDLLIF